MQEYKIYHLTDTSQHVLYLLIISSNKGLMHEPRLLWKLLPGQQCQVLLGVHYKWQESSSQSPGQVCLFYTVSQPFAKHHLHRKKFQNKQCSWGANEKRAKSSLFNLLRFLHSIPNWPTLSKKKAPSNSYVNCCLSADLQLNCRMLWDRSLQKEEQTLG